MEDRVGPARRIGRVAPRDAESQPGVKSRRLRVLLVDIDPSYAAFADEIFHQLPAHSFAARLRRNEEHFEHIAVATCERSESPEHPVLVQALRSAGFSCLAGCPGLVPALLSCGCSGFRRLAARLPDDV